MKTYKIKLLTRKAGIIELTVSEADSLEAWANKVQAKYGSFVQLSITEIN